MSSAARYVRSKLVAGSTFRRLITGVETRDERYERALHEIERREPRIYTKPGHGTKRGDLRPAPVAPSAPWSADPDTIANETRVVCTCIACDGEKRVSCGVCGADGRVRCGGCSGSGRVLGQRGRMKNCPDCRGRGEVKCYNCTNGTLPCDACDRVGRVVAWVEIERSFRDVVVAPPTVAGRAHAQLLHPDDFDAEGAWPSDLERDDELLPSAVPPELMPALDPARDRILSVRHQCFVVPTTTVRFETAVGGGQLTTAGRFDEVVAADVGAFSRRLSLAIGTAIIVGFSLFIGWYSRGHRHVWFAVEGRQAEILALGAVALAGLFVAVLGLALGRRGWTPIGTLLPALSCVLLMTGSVALASSAQPDGEHALARLAAGDAAGARVEAEAVLHVDAAGADAARRTLDELHLSRARAADDREALRRVVEDEPWELQAAHESAALMLRERVVADAERAVETEDAGALAILEPEAATLAPEMVDSIRSMRTILALDACVAEENWLCVDEMDLSVVAPRHASRVAESRERAIRAMQDRLRQASDAADQLSVPTVRAAAFRNALFIAETISRWGLPPAVSVASLTHRIERADAAAAAAAAEAEREERAREAREAREERELAARVARDERARAAREAREDARREREFREPSRGGGCAVRCCDGTCSPSCTSAHSGCCSNHGGVC